MIIVGVECVIVNKPFNILIIAALSFVGYLAMRFTGVCEGKNAAALLVPTVDRALYAVWEWFVVIKSPEANIRVDLLIIWPVLLILSIWFVVKALR